MADLRRFDIDELVNRPGTYVNPQTEVVIVVDDSATLDAELFPDASDEGEWVHVSDDVPVEEARRDELLERVQRRAQRALGTTTSLEGDHDEADEPDEDEDDLQAAGFDDPAAYDEDDY